MSNESIARGVLSAREGIQGRGYDNDYEDGSLKPSEIEAAEMAAIMLRSEKAADEDSKPFYKQMAIDYGDDNVRIVARADGYWDELAKIFADVDGR